MRWSKLISIVLHPVFTPIIAVYFGLNYSNESYFVSNFNVNIVYLFVVLYSLFFPLITVLFLLKLGIVKSIEVRGKKERLIVASANFIWLTLCYFSLQKIFVFFPILKVILLGIIAILFIAGIISNFWKISLHMIGMGGLLGVLLGINNFYALYFFILFGILLTGIIASARLYENAHNNLQLFTGFFLGLFIELLFIANY